MSSPLNILISSAGRRVELIHCFRRAAAALAVPVRVLTCDANPSLSPASLKADASFAVPRCDHASFINRLLELCATERIALVVPTIDTELTVLATHRDCFRRVGTELAISSPEVVEIARNKLRTAEFLEDCRIPVPRTVPLAQVLKSPDRLTLPIILKPAAGSSSIGIHICRTVEDVERVDLPQGDYVAQELWTGKEYTVNLFFDRERIRCVIPHWRIEARAGEVSKAITERVPILHSISERLGQALAGKAFGPLLFQAIVTPAGDAAVFEINARFGGGYPLADHAGATFAKWLLEIALGRPSTANNDWREKVQMLRYDSSVFQELA